MTMMGLPYWNDQLGKVDPNVTRLYFNITAAKTLAAVVPNTAQLTFFDALATQSVIDTFYQGGGAAITLPNGQAGPGTPNQFPLAAFDATAMGTDALGVLINMNGQVKQLVEASVSVYTGAGGATTTGATHVLPSATLTNSSLTTQAAVSSVGNVALRSVITGLDALTSGIVVVSIAWIAK